MLSAAARADFHCSGFVHIFINSFSIVLTVGLTDIKFQHSSKPYRWQPFNKISMKHFLFLIALLNTLGSLHSQSLRVPAEWEKQEKVHIAWFGNMRRDSVLCRVVEALQPTTRITLNIYDDSIASTVRQTLSKYKIDTSKIEFVTDPFADFWTRDPVYFVKDNERLKIVCFNYSMYGVFPDLAGQQMPDEIRKIGEYDERLAVELQLPTIKSDLVFEGGGLETNGKGTFLLIKEMALQRNPRKSIAEIEVELRRTVGAKKIIWLKDGLIEDKTFKNYAPFFKNYFGGGANMHIDELCRFVNETTVVLPYISKSDRFNSPVDSINYLMLEENYRILTNATTSDGRALIIRRVPMPEIEQLKFTQVLDSNTVRNVKQFGFSVGDSIYRIPAASYLNFFVSNNVVLIPKYWKPGMHESQFKKDQEAKNLFSKLFPQKKIVQIFTLGINRGGGGIHCMTHEQPQ